MGCRFSVSAAISSRQVNSAVRVLHLWFCGLRLCYLYRTAPNRTCLSFLQMFGWIWHTQPLYVYEVCVYIYINICRIAHTHIYKSIESIITE